MFRKLIAACTLIGTSFFSSQVIAQSGFEPSAYGYSLEHSVLDEFWSTTRETVIGGHIEGNIGSLFLYLDSDQSRLIRGNFNLRETTLQFGVGYELTPEIMFGLGEYRTIAEIGGNAFVNSVPELFVQYDSNDIRIGLLVSDDPPNEWYHLYGQWNVSDNLDLFFAAEDAFHANSSTYVSLGLHGEFDALEYDIYGERVTFGLDTGYEIALGTKLTFDMSDNFALWGNVQFGYASGGDQSVFDAGLGIRYAIDERRTLEAYMSRGRNNTYTQNVSEVGVLYEVAFGRQRLVHASVNEYFNDLFEVRNSDFFN